MVFYKTLKKYNEIELMKKPMDLNYRKLNIIHPPHIRV